MEQREREDKIVLGVKPVPGVDLCLLMKLSSLDLPLPSPPRFKVASFGRQTKTFAFDLGMEFMNWLLMVTVMLDIWESPLIK